MALEQVDAGLRPPDYRAILTVLEVVGRAGTVDEFRHLAMEAVDEHLGYVRSIFFVGGQPNPGFVLFEGSTDGLIEVDLEEYLENWTGSDRCVASTATSRMRRGGMAGLNDLGGPVDSYQRRYVEDFLLRQSSSQLSLWLDTGLPQHGYLSIFGRRSDEFGARDRATLMALRPHLSSLLRAILLEGRRAPGMEQLSEREAELARLVALGCGNREIARHLGIQEDTVKKHLWRAMHKLKVRNRTQLALVLMRRANDSTLVL
jgi:DNA-binding CsgD family transcriptional regulator